MESFLNLWNIQDLEMVLQSFLMSVVPLYIGIFLLGTVVGSYINSWIWRVHNHQWLWGGRSKCVHCSRTLQWYENVPIVSFLVLKGKCRTCRAPIPFDYVVVELIVPLLFLIVTYVHLASAIINPWHYFRDIFFTVVLTVIFVYDYKYMEIPSGVVWGGALVAFAINYFTLFLSPWSLVVGLAIGGGFFLVQYLVSHGRWVGGGDVRLGAMIGVLLGFPGILVGLFCAYMFGMVVAVPLLLTRAKNMHSEIPFGTFLAIGTYIALMWGEKIVVWYSSLVRFG